MNLQQSGYSTAHLAILTGLIAILALIVIPQVNGLVAQNQVNEGFHLASESRIRVAEFFMLSDRFPTSDGEKKMVIRNIPTPPEFVSEVVLENNGDDNGLMVKVYFKHDTVAAGSAREPYIYLEARRAPGAARDLLWVCGSNGIDSGLLPGKCQG